MFNAAQVGTRGAEPGAGKWSLIPTGNTPERENPPAAPSPSPELSPPCRGAALSPRSFYSHWITPWLPIPSGLRDSGAEGPENPCVVLFSSPKPQAQIPALNPEKPSLGAAREAPQELGQELGSTSGQPRGRGQTLPRVEHTPHSQDSTQEIYRAGGTVWN